MLGCPLHIFMIKNSIYFLFCKSNDLLWSDYVAKGQQDFSTYVLAGQNMNRYFVWKKQSDLHMVRWSKSFISYLLTLTDLCSDLFHKLINSRNLYDITIMSFEYFTWGAGDVNILSRENLAVGRVMRTCHYEHFDWWAGWQERFATSTQSSWMAIRLIWYLGKCVCSISVNK